MAHYSTMIDSTDDLKHLERLRERVQDEGYLYFRRLVDPKRVLRVKRDIMDLLRAHFIIEDEGAAEPLWSGGPKPIEPEWMAVYDRIVRLDSF